MKSSKIHKLTFFLVISIFLLSLSSCAQSGEKADSKTDKGSKEEAGHAMTKKQQKALINDLKENVKIINGVREDTSTLSKALTGALLESTLKQHSEDAANDIIRVRKYSSPKFEIGNYVPGTVGVTMKFTDKGYLMNSDTKEKLDKPKNDKTTLLLALMEEDDRWKIFEILQEIPKEE